MLVTCLLGAEPVLGAGSGWLLLLLDSLVEDLLAAESLEELTLLD